MAGIKSAERVLALFEYFSTHQQPATIKDVSEALDMPQSSTSMLVKNLVELGYLLHDRTTRAYMPSLRIALLGNWVAHDRLAAPPLVNKMRALRDDVQHPVILAMRNDVYAQYILVVDAQTDRRLLVQSGMLRPLTRSAAGIALMAGLTGDEIGLITRRLNANAADESGRRREADVIADVEAFREQGWFMNENSINPDVAAISIAVKTNQFVGPLAVSVVGRRDNVVPERDELAAKLKAFGAEWSEAETLVDMDEPMTPLPFYYRELTDNTP